MPGRVEQQRTEDRKREIDAIGPADSARLHGGMNKSDNSKEKREHKQPNVSSGRRDGDSEGSASQATTSTSGSKRHASAGAGPSEPTRTTAEREGKRATITRAEEGDENDVDRPTKRNDADMEVEAKPMHDGSSRKAKPIT